jgi:DNA polymerase-3 subunit alpha
MDAMPDPSFVHLRLHSEYSVVDGIVRLDEAIDAAVNDRMPALALTDLGNMFGLVKFYKDSRARGVKAIAGCDVWISTTPIATSLFACCSCARTAPAIWRSASS